MEGASRMIEWDEDLDRVENELNELIAKKKQQQSELWDILKSEDTGEYMLANYLFAPQFIGLEAAIRNAVTKTDLNRIWKSYKLTLNVIKNSDERLLYDVLEWQYKRELDHVSTKTETTKGS